MSAEEITLIGHAKSLRLAPVTSSDQRAVVKRIKRNTRLKRRLRRALVMVALSAFFVPFVVAWLIIMGVEL